MWTFLVLIGVVRWLKSIFWSNGDEADKSAKFFLVTLLVLSFDFWGGAASGCEHNV